jgi:hypothetical protein
LIKAVTYRTYTVKACGRACPDMDPATLPVLLPRPLVSLAEIQRKCPGMIIEVDVLPDPPDDESSN